MRFKIFFKKYALVLIIILFILLTLLTSYYGSMDIGDYADSAKYFANAYHAKTRNAHSYLYGLILSPFVALTNSFIFFKVFSIIILLLIILSVYKISKNKKGLWLILFSPVIWYMAPWISPIQLASLFLLWAYYFINNYNKNNKVSHLIYSGLLLGLAFSFWNTILYFAIFLGIVFLINKKLYHSIFFIIAFLIGAFPLLILDQVLFNFPFYTLAKTTMSQFLFVLFGQGIYGMTENSARIFITIFVLISIPFYFWMLYKPSLFKENKKTMIFLSLSLITLLLPSPRIIYLLSIIPIIIVLLSRYLNKEQFKKQLIYLIIITIIFMIPYIIQINVNINNSVNGIEIYDFITTLPGLTFSQTFPSDSIQEDLNQIAREFPNQVFIVGNHPDDYQLLAHLYWGDKISEFVSIQDYELFLRGESSLFEKKLISQPKISDRRQIWIAGGMQKNENDPTDYDAIEFGIGVKEPIDIEDFAVVKKFEILYISKKAN